MHPSISTQATAQTLVAATLWQSCFKYPTRQSLACCNSSPSSRQQRRKEPANKGAVSTLQHQPFLMTSRPLRIHLPPANVGSWNKCLCPTSGVAHIRFDRRSPSVLHPTTDSVLHASTSTVHVISRSGLSEPFICHLPAILLLD